MPGVPMSCVHDCCLIDVGPGRDGQRGLRLKKRGCRRRLVAGGMGSWVLLRRDRLRPELSKMVIASALVSMRESARVSLLLARAATVQGNIDVGLGPRPSCQSRL